MWWFVITQPGRFKCWASSEDVSEMFRRFWFKWRNVIWNDFKIDLMMFSTWGDSQKIDDALGLTSKSAYCFIRLWMLKLPGLVLGRQWQTTQCNPLINSVKVNSWFIWIDAEDVLIYGLKGNILLFWPQSCLREIDKRDVSLKFKMPFPRLW